MSGKPAVIVLSIRPFCIDQKVVKS